MPQIPLVVSNPEQLQQSWVGKAPIGERPGREKAGMGAGGRSSRLAGLPALLCIYSPLLPRFTAWFGRQFRAGMRRRQQGSTPELRRLLKKIPFTEKKCRGRKRGAQLALNNVGVGADSHAGEIHV